MKIIKNYIDGKSTNISKNTLPITNPSTGEIISEVVISNENDFKQAIESSKKHLKYGQKLRH